MAEKRSAAATAGRAAANEPERAATAGRPGANEPERAATAGRAGANEPGRAATAGAAHGSDPGCAAAGEPVCPFFHEAVELVGRRWTGVILRALMDGPLRFSEVAAAIPELSDRLLSERMKELEARGLVTREVLPGRPLRVRYSLSQMGRDLEPALGELQRWARRWLRPPGRA